MCAKRGKAAVSSGRVEGKERGSKGPGPVLTGGDVKEESHREAARKTENDTTKNQ